MTNNVTLSYQEYEALVALARKGAQLEGTMRAFEGDPTLRRLWEKGRTQYGWDPNLVRELEYFLKSIEKHNGITRHFLAIRWTESGVELPARVAGAPTRFPENWPPIMEASVELLTRPIARTDVDAVVTAKATQPLNVMVTSDPGKRVGWTLVDDYFK